MDRQTQELIRQHTFVCLALVNHALHVAHVAFHAVRDVHHAAPTAENYTALLDARSRLKFAMTIEEQANAACSAQDKFPPHPFFTEGFWK
jgi:hypothetical protein